MELKDLIIAVAEVIADLNRDKTLLKFELNKFAIDTDAEEDEDND